MTTLREVAATYGSVRAVEARLRDHWLVSYFDQPARVFRPALGGWVSWPA